ncbi:MAG: hypothetical protein JW857_05745 [Bacteroidales bacterium]|nr:hypothetical protein [Bacteroidales bacterium]
MRFSVLRTLVLLLFSLVLLSACNRNSFDVDVSDIPKPKVHISDYGSALFSINRDSLAKGLQTIQNKYALFLGTDSLSDEQINQLSNYVNDPFLDELFASYKIKFPSLLPLEDDLVDVFRHLLFYYPSSKIPEVYAYISGVQGPLIYQDHILVLGLDNYLGSDFETYAKMGIPRYKIRAMSPDYVIKDVALALSIDKITAPNADGTVLDFMLYEAKKLYFVKSMFPKIKDQILLNYTEEQLRWFAKNESELWKYYIENELLFKSDFESINKFINDAPFTSVLGNNSPSRTGVWLGYQILLRYAKNNEVTLTEILANTQAQEILNQSKYKPRR